MTVEIKTTVKGGESLRGGLFDKRVAAGLLRVATNYKAALLRSNLVPVDTGAGRGSIGIKKSAGGARIRVGSPLVQMLIMERGRRPGKRGPPLEPIRKWVKLKLRREVAAMARELQTEQKIRKAQIQAQNKVNLQIARQKGRKKIPKARLAKVPKVGKLADLNKRALNQLAFLIRRKIHEKGIKIPLKHDKKGAMFRKTLEKTRKDFPAWFKLGFDAVA